MAASPLPPLPRIYAGLAPWWPLFSHPDDYAGEAAWILGAFAEALGRKPGQILDLGSGGGNAASHLTPHAPMTLVDLAPEMVEVSRRLNPKAEHVQGDMRTIRLGKSFDAVMIHDAIMYMTSEADLVAALATARAHLKPDGALIVLPDYVAETFEPRVQTGGHDARDGSTRGLRYVAWAHAPKAGATAHDLDFAFLLRSGEGQVEVFHDRHRIGLFTREAWLKAFARAGCVTPRIIRDPWKREVFLARTPAS
ncbi:MAG: hypothetical protein QOI12_2251 [Alphaproteobacteria bacterium]|jgi:SAM-dependent methyltransferase|nr:hypothetical protein [Alphaproteobacteria bacterium]